MEIIPLTGGLGAEIFGADLTDVACFDSIQQAFVDHAVIVIREQNISPDDHLHFARRFGDINVNRFFSALPSHPEIAVVFKDINQKEAVGEGWHTDHSYDQIPALGSILHAIEMPKVGGDTLFESMSMAFEALSPTMQSFLSDLSAWHSSRHVFGAETASSEAAKTRRLANQNAATQDALHPVVIKHPLSGKSCLYVNPVFTTRIQGLSEAESDGILQMLYTHIQQPEFQCRIRWKAGDVTMWDNRATWHKAINDYHGQRRLMHRVTVEGCAIGPILKP